MRQITGISVSSCILVLLTLIVSACRLPYSDEKTVPVAVDGTLDMSAYDLETRGPLKLEGEWAFLWRHFQPETKGRRINTVIDVPGAWNHYREEGRPVGGSGFATYRLTVILPEAGSGRLALFVPDQWTAYELYADGQLIVKAGKIGQNETAADPRISPSIGLLNVTGTAVELTLLISNFHFFKGGIKRAPLLGLASDIYEARELRVALELFLSGSFFMIGLYHIGLFLSRRKDLSVLLFGLINLLVCAITLATGERFIHRLFPGTLLNASQVYRIIYCATYLVTPMLYHFISLLFGNSRSQKLTRYVYGVSVMFTGSVMVLPSHVFTSFLSVFLVFLLVVSVNMISLLVKASMRGRSGAVIVLGGMVVLISAATLDILKALGFYSSDLPRFTSPALFVFIWAQSAMLSRLFAQAFQNVETLSDELERKNEELTRLDTLKDEFLSNTSHELRTPLNGIIGLADSMLNGIGGPHKRQTVSNLEMISSSGRRLSNLVNDILDFSRLKQNTILLKKKPVDISTMIDVVFQLFEPQLGNKAIRFINDCRDLPAVLADEDRLEQVLYNLIGNAVKFTDQGSVQVSARQEGGLALISVCDTGIGIPLDRQAVIFNSFQQADGSISRIYGGTGLGLSITRQLIELHGGTIHVESPCGSLSTQTGKDGGNGTCLCFTLPLADENVISARPHENRQYIRQLIHGADVERQLGTKEMDSADLEKTRVGVSRKDRPTVLVVDDDRVNLQVVENYLDLKAYRVVKAQTGREALETLERLETVDVILLDLMMPGLSGFDVCRHIRKTCDPNELPIIMLTAKTNVTDFSNSLAAGANDYLTKPFSFSELVSRTDNQLKLSRYYRELKALTKELQQKVKERTHELEQARNNAVAAMEKAESASRAKSSFLSNMSHELRTPLNAILGFSELMSRDSGMSREQLVNLGIINRSGEHLLSLINGVLELSKIEAGQIVFNPEHFNLHRLLLDLKEMFRLRTRQKGLFLNIEQGNTVPHHICSDQNKLRQILINLLGNALKFTETGGITLSVTNRNPGEHIQSGNCLLHFEVNDTGPGISKDDQKKIFEAFVQSGSQSSSQQGTGLGLSISRTFVEQLGGELRVASELGQGACFSFDLPVEPMDGVGPEMSRSENRVTGLKKGTPVFRLLVVDDNESNRRLLVQLLRAVGFEVEEAVNGRDAVVMSETWHPHLIWMDMHMPVMDGYEATMRIKKAQGGNEIVIIALTASAFEEDRAKVFEHGGDDFVRKPFRENEIFDMLSRHLGVAFIHGTLAEDTSEKTGMSLKEMQEAASELPDGLTITVKEALARVDFDAAVILLEEIKKENEALASALADHLNEYEFDILEKIFEGEEH